MGYLSIRLSKAPILSFSSKLRRANPVSRRQNNVSHSLLLYFLTLQNFSESFLRPTGFANDTLSPDGIDRTIATTVNRDGGNVDLASDWFTLCDIGRFSASTIGFIGLFVDTSGSMRLSTVQASYDAFLADVADANLEIAQVFNGQERFVTPFLTDLAP